MSHLQSDNKIHRFTLRIPENQWARLRAYAQYSGTTVTSLVAGEVAKLCDSLPSITYQVSESEANNE